MNLLAIIAGAATGIVLGVFGSGGSIITTPSLLYLLQVEPKPAIAVVASPPPSPPSTTGGAAPWICGWR
jgi:uncharacterized membrane protein YfcA